MWNAVSEFSEEYLGLKNTAVEDTSLLKIP